MEERGRERRIYSPQGYGRGKKVEETRRRAEEDGRDEAERKGGRNGEGKNGETRTKGASPGWRCTSSGHWHETVHFYRGREGWESSGFNGRTLPLPLTRRNLLCQASFVRSFVRSFVSLDPSSARLIFDDLYPKGAAIPAKESLLQSLLPSRRRKGRPTGVIDTR